jgi:threonylcarbamoyladenosine tRNA methylthiotransferase MtaB
MLTLNEEDGRRFRQQFLGQTVQVLIEGYRQGYWEGLTDNYLRVEINGLPDHPGRDWRNTLVSAQLTHLVNDGVRGVFVEQSEDRFRS